MSTPMASPPEVETFITTYGLDERVSKGLRELPVQLQIHIASAPLDQARNPSAVVWSRVRAAQQDAKARRRRRPPFPPTPCSSLKAGGGCRPLPACFYSDFKYFRVYG